MLPVPSEGSQLIPGPTPEVLVREQAIRFPSGVHTGRVHWAGENVSGVIVPRARSYSHTLPDPTCKASCLPPGRICGQRWVISFLDASECVTATGSPPAGDIRNSGLV